MTNGANIFERLTQHLDYLQRTGDGFDLPPLGSATLTSTTARQVVPVRSVGRLAKTPATEARQAPYQDWQLTQYASEAFLIGLHQIGYPIAFLLHGAAGRTSISLGLWSGPGSAELPSPNQTTELFQSLLDGAYPGTEIGSAKVLMTHKDSLLGTAGLVRGVPTPKPPDASDGAFAVDRLVRAMGGLQWRVYVLATPCSERFTRTLRGRLLGEMRSIDSRMQASSPNPLAAHYSELLKVYLEALSAAQGVGAWRVGVYLLGTSESYARLAGGWRGIFSGDLSIPEPIRVTHFDEAAKLAAGWELPDTREQPGPSGYNHGYSHPFKYQTILSSSQLAAYIHLPQLETIGFPVKVTPDFDTVPPSVDPDRALKIGDIINRSGIAKIARERAEKLEASRGMMATAAAEPRAAAPRVRYSVDKGSLENHTFVTGITGSGKTNAIFHLLQEAMRARIPFLVLEPAKSEYRMLLHDELAGPELQIFTVGAEWGSPLRLNPFEIMPGISVSLHLDLLRSVFNAGFGGMWPPLPQVLERSLYAIYEDRGWDLTKRLVSGESEQPAFPTLTDLIYKVQEIVPQLGYDADGRGRVLGSLVTRLDGLRTGPKGRMYDVPRSIDIETVLDHPTILELDTIGDDDDKAFFMGLLFIKLVEYRRVCNELGYGNQPHLLVVEEAHRLLTNASRNASEQADSRGKAVESFTNLISEIRAYRQGVIISDQVPTRLAPDVIKNTNLKIAHRVVAGDDREVLGKAMSMNDLQVDALGSLPDLVAAVFSGGKDDAPLLVEMDDVKRRLSDKIEREISRKIPPDNTVRELMWTRRSLAESRWRFFRIPECESYCQVESNGSADGAGVTNATDGECLAAKKALDHDSCRKALTRLILTAMENSDPIKGLGKDLRVAVRTQTPDNADPEHVYHCFLVRVGGWISDRWGMQRRWTQSKTERFAVAVRSLLLTLEPFDETYQGKAILAFQQVALDLHERKTPPYPSCEAICNQHASCLYRYPVREMLQRYPFPGGIHRMKVEKPVDPKQKKRVLDSGKVEGHIGGAVAQLLAYESKDQEVREALKRSTIRAQLCFVQQAIVDDNQIHPRVAENLMEQIIEEWKPEPHSLGGADATSAQEV